MRKPRVFVFDDDEFVRELLVAVFTREGFEVFAYSEPTFCPVYAGHDCSQSNRCADVVITDLFMKEMNGADFLERLVTRGCKMDMRNRALMSGSFRPEHMRTIESLGCAWFRKPFSVQEVISWMKECSSRFRLDEPLEFLERRTETRIPSAQVVDCRIPSGSPGNFAGTVLNRSGRGLCLAIPVSVEEGGVVRVRSKTGDISQQARVQWIREEPPDGYVAGLFRTANT